ncbi:MAG: lysylphosphatidylglycerol synthase domain-containing protein [Candidatus Woesearchaeota archaeon]|nr:lysylphosphatidylglycerol synthase domain-containing protein [Candidatus Woesearchaeota archaeon]
MKKLNIGKIIGVLVSLFILYFLAKTLYQNWSQLKSYSITFNYFYLALSFIFLFAHLLLSVYGWKMIMNLLKAKLDFKSSIRIWFLSQLGRYVPGRIWYLLGRMYLCEKKKISKYTTFVSLMLELAMHVLSASFTALIFVPAMIEDGGLMKFLPVFLTIPVGLILIHPKIFNFFVNIGLKIFRKKTVELKIKYSSLLGLLAFYMFSWVVNGMGFYLLIKSFYATPLSLILPLTGAFAVSWIIGFLSLITPSGLGIREGILTFLLGFYFPLPIAIIISLVSRLWIIFGELVGAGVSFKFK